MSSNPPLSPTPAHPAQVSHRRFFSFAGIALAVAAILSFACAIPAQAEVTLVEDGRINTVVVVSEELLTEPEEPGSFNYFSGSGQHPTDDPFAQSAIEELQEHFALLGEGELEIIEVAGGDALARAREQVEAGHAVIVLGDDALDADLTEALVAAHADRRDEGVTDPHSYGIEVGDGMVKVVGFTPKGVLNGTYELLEMLGFRWYMPGDFGRVVPEGATFGLDEGRTFKVPSLEVHKLSLNGPQTTYHWGQRQRHGVFRTSGGHGIAPLSSSGARRNWFEESEEHHKHFRLRDGERAPGQLCLTMSLEENADDPEHNEVLAMAIEAMRSAYESNPHRAFYGMGPNDGSGFCECGPCEALDEGEVNPFSGRRSVTDRYIWFYNQVLEHVTEDFPNARIGFLAYADMMMPPTIVEPHPNMVGRLAMIHICRHHAPNNPVCPDRYTYKAVAQGWADVGVRLDNSGYWFNLACPGLPFAMMSRIREEIPLSYELNHMGFRRSTATHWANEGPSLYLAYKLMWDHETDVDALLDEFYTKFYGPAAEPMERYWTLLDHTLRDADHHTGRSFDMIHIYDEEVRSDARAALAEAESLATDGLYATRVQVAAQGWEYFEAYAEMVESRNRHDYVRSMAAVERANELIETLTSDYEIPMLRVQPGSTAATRFLNVIAGHAQITADVYPRITDGNELVVGLDPTWDFFQDLGDLGRTMGLYREELTGGNFQPMDTRLSWGNHGLHYYFGTAWYRQRVDVPAGAADHDDLSLWFAMVDRYSDVWVNGEHVGGNTSVRPFALDVTEAIRPGEANVIAVRVERRGTFELGTGGIFGPAMIYAGPAQIEDMDQIDHSRYEAELQRLRERGW